MYRGNLKADGSPEQGRQDIDVNVLRVLVENRRKFLGFVERAVGNKDLAEDILQEALARGIDRHQSIRDDKRIVAWFYRVLRNAVLDYYRRTSAASRGLEALSKELESAQHLGEESQGGSCKCVGHLATELKPEYAEVLQRVEIDGVAVKTFAQEQGLSSGNTGVRVFRARQALRRAVMTTCGDCATDGCQNCSCGEPTNRSAAKDL